jgi:hypothetical protein
MMPALMPPAVAMAPTLVTLLALAAAPGEEFARGRTAFFRAEYGRAIEILRPLLYPELRLETEDEAVQAHRMLAVAYLFENQPDEARREFRKLLELRPDYRLDPLLDPPRVVDFFNEVVKEQAGDVAAVEARRRRREADRAARRQEDGAPVIRRVEKRSLVVALLPFGAGQFQNGERRKGWAFFAAESALAATSLGAFALNFGLFGVRPVRPCLDPIMPDPGGDPAVCPADRIDHSGEELSRNLTRLQIISGALFFGVAVWGAVDALRGFRPEVVVDEPSGSPGPGQPGAVPSGKPAAAARRSGPSVHAFAFPLLTASAQGAAVGVAF